MKHTIRLFHTIRHLRVRQIAYRLYYRWRRLSVPPMQIGNRARVWTQDWHSPQWQSSHMGTDGQFEFLNESGRVNSAEDWNNPDKAKLWLYHLHYLDELNTQNADNRVAALNRLIDRWMDDNPAPLGNGWEPYPLSLRLVNLVKWQMRQHYPGSRLLDSIQQQANALTQQIEYHIMANHLFANGKALVFAGAALAQGDGLLQQGLRILDAEIPEQFLADGGHFERSPMYHAILLWDLCDLVNLVKISALPELQSREPDWAEVIKRGLAWLAQMSHPDGEIAFFNDSTLGIAPCYADLCQYANMLGITTPTSKASLLSVTYLYESGYIVAESAVVKLIIDIGRIGPDYQPGHAHADTLSFELSLFGQRVFVNSGISQYGMGAERNYQRSTQAHNTVVVDGKNSSDVWGGFRVGRCALPMNISIEESNKEIKINCSHDGYKKFIGGVIHNRQFILTNSNLEIKDQLLGKYEKAESNYYFHPSVNFTPFEANKYFLCFLKNKEAILSVPQKNQKKLYESIWFSGFNKESNNHLLNIKLEKTSLKTCVTWKI